MTNITRPVSSQRCGCWLRMSPPEHAYEPDEICVRFHHRLVSIHPFPNGNGRHSRICADFLAAARMAPFIHTSELRRRYQTALRAADAGEIHELLTFARS